MKIFFKQHLNVSTLSYLWRHNKAFVKYHKKGWFSYYLVFVLNHSLLPKFVNLRLRHTLLRSASWYRSFSHDFIKCAKSGLTPKIAIIEYGKEKDKFSKVIKKMKTELRGIAWPFQQIWVVPNFWGEEGHGYGILMGQTAYLVYRPNPKVDSTWLLAHELLHCILGPEFEKPAVRKKIQATKNLYRKLVPARLQKYYPKWEWAIEEYVIHAIESDITNSSIAVKKKWGWGYVDLFINKWKKRGNKSFVAWLLETIDETAKLNC